LVLAEKARAPEVRGADRNRAQKPSGIDQPNANETRVDQLREIDKLSPISRLRRDGFRLQHPSLVRPGGAAGDGGVDMALEGPRLIYTRKEEDESGDVLARALGLARQVEDLLDETGDLRGSSSTRIVRAMAASLVDELEAIVRGKRKSGLS
jgi:hypothetical protein